MEVLGGNIPVICDGAGSTDITGVVRPQISQSALTHGYFTQSQNKWQGIISKAIAGQKCTSDTPRPKPNRGHQIKQRSK